MSKKLTEEQISLYEDAKKTNNEVNSNRTLGDDHRADLLIKVIANCLLFMVEEIVKNSEQENN